MTANLVLQLLAVVLPQSALVIVWLYLSKRAKAETRNLVHLFLLLGFGIVFVSGILISLAQTPGIVGNAFRGSGLKEIPSWPSAKVFYIPEESAGWFVRVGAVWTIGLQIAVVIVLIEVFRLVSIVQAARPLNANEFSAIQEALSADLLSNGIPRILCSKHVKAPCCTELRNPVILLPEDFVEEISEDDLRMLLKHEVAHLRRNDVRLLFLQRLIGALYWWNPVVHLLNRNLSNVREELCDLDVAKDVGRKRYAQFLLDAGKLWSKPQRWTLGVTRSYRDLKRRISSTLEPKGKSLLCFGERPVLATFVIVWLCVIGIRPYMVTFESDSPVVRNPDVYSDGSKGMQELIHHVSAQMERGEKVEVIGYIRSEEEVSSGIFDVPSAPQRQVENLMRASPGLYDSVPELKNFRRATPQ